jgi:hypothetical protein
MNIIKITCLFFLFFVFSSELFPQLDSVYYQGPSQGSVSSGAMQTTDNYGPEMSIPESPILKKERVFSSEPIILDLENEQTSECVYIDDINTGTNSGLGNGQTVLLNTFPGIGATNATPPDPIMAAGPNHIIAFVNGFPSVFRIFNKEGEVLKTINSASWWAPVAPDEYGDPQVLYDHYAGRWILQVMQYNSSNFSAATLLAYSDDDDPLGTWYVYRLDTKMHGTVPSNTWGDYPKMGYDEEAIYVSTRCFQFGGGLLYNKIRIINKAELYSSNGGPLTWNDIWDIRSPNSVGLKPDVIRPSISYTPGEGGYFLWSSNGGANFYLLYRIFNPSTAPRLRAINVPSQYYGHAPNANQLGAGTQLDAIGSWMYGAPIIRGNNLFAAHSIQNSLFPSNSSAKYLIIDLGINQITENSELGAQGYFYLYSTLTVDQDNNIAMTFSRSADTEYCGAFYSTKYASDPPGLSPSLPFKEGEGIYSSGNPSRWGDYQGIYLDPNNYDVWMFTEYAARNNAWSTYVGHIRMVPFSGTYVHLNPSQTNFGDVEIGTTSPVKTILLANYGEDDLIITNIPSSFEEFNLVTNLTFPVTLSTYDSLTLEFTYSPTDVGTASTFYPITTNDPIFNGITLSGNGYQIVPAIEKTIYASSGNQNDGNIVTINLTTGAGSAIGESLFSELKGLAINPLNGIIYGLAVNSGTAEIVRVNSEFGDSYSLFPVNIPSIADIAFDTLGTLYGIGVNGELSTIDLSNGDVTFMVDALGSYSGITFNPQTNEMWATSRSFLPPNKDAIFKVNISTGDTSIVGHTGLNKLTNDLVFDENLNLYGVIGSASELNDFISINADNGSGSIIGSVGMKNILGLAYIGSNPTSIENNADNFPSEYELFQNYPNPFNPTTIISYQLPTSGFVTLKVFDILGNEIATLVNEEKTSGKYDVEFFRVKGQSSGVYIYQLRAGSFIQARKMLLLK